LVKKIATSKDNTKLKHLHLTYKQNGQKMAKKWPKNDQKNGKEKGLKSANTGLKKIVKKINNYTRQNK